MEIHGENLDQLIGVVDVVAVVDVVVVDVVLGVVGWSILCGLCVVIHFVVVDVGFVVGFGLSDSDQHGACGGVGFGVLHQDQNYQSHYQ